MFSWFKNRRIASDSARYAVEKEIAQSERTAERLRLAKDPKTSKDILFYMAQMDGDVRVRQAVAENKTTPIQASALLSKDKSEDVRLSLARRMMTLLPDLSQDKQSQLYKFAAEALGILALDEVLKIRMALSSTLKDMTDTPPNVAGQLARDVEREVSEPILRVCVALSDDDLLDILKNHPASWAVQAIAGRPRVTEIISQAVIDTDDVPAGAILMNNTGAEISLHTLKDIVEKAKSFPEWQKPIAMRKNIPADMAKELAGFVDQSVRNILLERTDFPADEMDDIAAIVKRRIDFADRAERGESVEDRVQALFKSGQLNDDAIGDALSMRDKEFVVASMAVLLRCPQDVVDKTFAIGAAKAVVALCWQAGLHMRTALRIQQEIVKVPHKELIYPKGGTDYPLTQEDLKWQLEYLGFVHKKN